MIEEDVNVTYYFYVLFGKKPGEVTSIGRSIDGSWCM